MDRMRYMKPIALFAVTLVLSGCAALFVKDDDVSDAERKQIEIETAPYLHKGTGSIRGVLQLNTQYGQFHGSPNTQVALTPATTIALARFEKYVVEKNEVPEQRKAELVFFTRTNPSGLFHFDNLPPGNYLLLSTVGWSPTHSPDDVRSAVLYARVTLSEGEAAAVVLTRDVEKDD